MADQTETEVTSRRKFDLAVGPEEILGGKTWVRVTFNRTGQQWIPSLADMHRICDALAFCEELKYPPEEGFAGGARIYEFLLESYKAWKDGRRYGDLARQFKIPERKADGTLVKTNGARVGDSQQLSLPPL